MLDKIQLVPNKFISDIMPKREIKEIDDKSDRPPVNTIEKKKKEVRKATVIVYK
jgi:hypothetical protein